ncbi:MAG: arsenic resistance N-acetyltransferase ArsN2 [Bacillota bacterium]
MSDLVFDSARPADREAVFSLLREAGLTTAGIAEDLAHFFVVRILSEVAGVVGLEYYGECALLRSLAVVPAHRGKGLGRRLAARALEAAAAHGAREVYLLTVTAPNFFERLGFATTDREDVPAPVRQSLEFREVCPASAAVLRLKGKRS